MDTIFKMSASPIGLLVFAAAISVVQCEFKLLVLHTNDMHSRFEETNAHSGECVKGRGKCYGGMARLKTAVDESKSKGKANGFSSVFLNAGDSFQGTVFYTMFKAKIVSEVVNMLGIDAMSLGNHEFDDGPEGLAPYVGNSTAKIVVSNIDYSKEPVLEKVKDHLTRSTVLEIDGKKIGVIGYLTPDTKFLSKVGKVKFEEEIPAIKREVAKLKGEGVKILIAVGHSGYVMDKKIGEQVPDLDLVVGGHTNTFLYTGKAPDIEKVEGPYPTVVTQESGRKVYVVQAYAYTKYLGHLQVTFDDNGEVTKCQGNPILLTEAIKKDEKVESVVQKYAEKVKEMAGRQVGTSHAFLEADDKTCRLRECNFGNLATDALIWMNAKDYTETGWTDAPVAFLQGGSFRSSIDTELSEGVITYSNLLTTFPFRNSVEKLKMSGELLKKVLEHSVEGYNPEERPGAFLQYSGIHVNYDLEKKKGERVVSARVRCGECVVPDYSPLDSRKTYTVLTSSFLADGGDDYTMIKEEAKDRMVLSFTDVDAVETYLTQKSPVNPEIQGRIVLAGNAAPSISPSVFTSLLCLVAVKASSMSYLDR